MVLDFFSQSAVVGGIVAIVFSVIFHRPIRRLIDRIKKLDKSGVEFDQLSQPEEEFTPKERNAGQVQFPASVQVSQDDNAFASLIPRKELATQKLLNAPLLPNDPVAKREWIDQVKEWEAAMYESLRDAGATDGELSDFKMVVSYSPVGPAVDQEHAEWKGMLAARIRTLGQIIRDLEKRR